MKFILLLCALLNAQKLPSDAKVVTKVKFTVKVGDNEDIAPIIIGLFDEEVPETAKNFSTICSTGVKNGDNLVSYSGSIFHRIIPQFMIQGGDITNFNGTGGLSIYGRKFKDENFNVKHDVGALSMANAGPNTNGSQFFITTVQTSWLDGRHVVFGRVVEGMDTVYAIEK